MPKIGGSLQGLCFPRTHSCLYSNSCKMSAVEMKHKRCVLLCLFDIQVQEFSKKYTHVITSGGIGPTHDDVTFEGVARAFGEHVSPHPELVAVCKEVFGTDDLASPKLKLAFIPESSTLRYGVDKTTGEKSRYPVVIVRNVYIFPGIPRLFEMAFVRLEDLFRNPYRRLCTRELFVNTDEFSITSVLNDANERFKDRVTIGSYPDYYNSYYKVKLTLESERDANIDSVMDFLQTQLPENSLVEFDHNPMTHAADKVYQIADGNDQFAMKVRKSLHVAEEAFGQYSWDKICVGFNGGKDCTALLHLVHAVACRNKPPGGTGRSQLPALYIRRGQPFPEIELFIHRTKSRYHLDLLVIDGRIKDALSKLKQIRPAISAVLMGTRRSDPNSAVLKDFSPTDSDWPAYMRVNPILDWTYSDVWTFVRRLSLPYCVLYDRGYTSLGSIENTHPNPQLKRVDDDGIVSYRPAYELSDQDSERAGRN